MIVVSTDLTAVLPGYDRHVCVHNGYTVNLVGNECPLPVLHIQSSPELLWCHPTQTQECSSASCPAYWSSTAEHHRVVCSALFHPDHSLWIQTARLILSTENWLVPACLLDPADLLINLESKNVQNNPITCTCMALTAMLAHYCLI